MFFRFAPMGKVEKTRFEQSYTTFVNPALCAAWKSPPKMVLWNRNCNTRFPGCFFVSPRWGKSKKRVLNKIIRPSSTRLYALLGKAHPKWCYETEIVKVDSQGVFSFRPDGESRKSAFWTKLYDLRQPGFMRCLEKPTQNGAMKPNCKIRFPGCVFVSPRWGKSKNRVLNKIIRPSSTPLYALLGKAHPKWWCEAEIVKFDSQGVFSFRPDGESGRNAFWTKLYDLRQPGFMRCLEKPTQNGAMKPNCKIRFPGWFFVSPRWGKSKNRVFKTKLYDLRQPRFMRCLEKPTQNGGLKPKL